jgi:RimJ/RimL family protein N-acetyltransferase
MNEVNLSDWNGAPRPERVVLEGTYARLEPLNVSSHASDLFRSAREEGAAERFRYLFDPVPHNEAIFLVWAEAAASSSDPLFFAVINKTTGRAEGRQALMRIDPANGVIEIGSILWGPAIARTRVATEAFHLVASYVFNTLGYRRLEWKCDNRNLPSKKAAARFGFTFEGIFRDHMVVKGQSRDTAWYSIIGSEWPRLSRPLTTWLNTANFNEMGQQRKRLEELRV